MGVPTARPSVTCALMFASPANRRPYRISLDHNTPYQSSREVRRGKAGISGTVVADINASVSLTWPVACLVQLPEDSIEKTENSYQLGSVGLWVLRRRN